MDRRIVFAAVLATALVTTSARAEESTLAPSHHTAAPWIVAGVGAGVVGVGILSFVGAVKAHDDARAEALTKGCTTSPVACPQGIDPTHLQTNVDGEHAMNVIGVILTATGGAALVTGLVWHFLEPARSRVAVAPMLGPGTFGMAVAARF